MPLIVRVPSLKVHVRLSPHFPLIASSAYASIPLDIGEFISAGKVIDENASAILRNAATYFLNSVIIPPVWFYTSIIQL